MVHETAGDPMTGLKWTRKTIRKIARELRKAGIDVSKNTVAKLLRQLGYSLRVNRKALSRSASPHRDEQFRYIQELRQRFERRGLPVISIDSKKKELVGCFKNPGAAWVKTPILVNDHDFRSDAVGIAAPYGILDLGANRGHVAVGISHDTAAFAVDTVTRWWTQDGRLRYPNAHQVLILADNGGSNGARTRAWKHDLHAKLSTPFRLDVTVCHYPPGTSKWNPIEHRLFSQITQNWAGRPLDTYDTMLRYLRTTRTSTGLQVRAWLTRRPYATGRKISPGEMAAVNLHRHAVLPEWNYTLRPGTPASTGSNRPHRNAK